MRQAIRFTLHAMAAEEVLDFIPVLFDRRIRERDPKPYYAVYAVAHEGESDARQAVDGKLEPSAIQVWEPIVIDRLAGALKPGTPVFHGHEAFPVSEHRDSSIGQVVGSAVREIGGRRFALAAIYYPPEQVSAARGFDVASVEVEITAQKIGDRKFLVLDIPGDAKGVAVDSSAHQRPAFRGATLQGAIAAFARDAEAEPEGEEQMPDITLEQVKAYLISHGVLPSVVFEMAALAADPKVKEIAEGAAKTATDKAAETHKEAAAEKDKEIGELKAKVAAMEGPGLVAAELAAMKQLTDGQRKYVGLRAKEFQPGAADEAGRKKEAGDFIQTQLAAFAELEKAGLVAGGGGKAGASAPNSDDPAWANGAPADGGDLMDPKYNEFMPERKESAA